MNPLITSGTMFLHLSNDLLFLVTNDNGHLMDSGDRERIELVIQDRLALHFDQAFRMFPVYRADPRSLTRGQNYRFHSVSLMVFVRGFASMRNDCAKNLRLK